MHSIGFSLRILLLLVLVAGLPFCELKAQTKNLHILQISSPKELSNFFRFSPNSIPLISGHRGGMEKGYPENSIASFEHTLRSTPAFFEVDPRLTKDSVIVLMHDETLDRTTTGNGKVSDYTWEELKKLNLKDKAGNVTAYHIPTLEEAITWSKGKTILNLDRKDVPPSMIARFLRDRKAEIHVMLTVHNAQQAKYHYEQNNKVMFSAHVLTKDAFLEYEKAGIPWSQTMAYIGPTYKPENQELLDLLHARGVMCMISAAPTYDKLQSKAERQNAYREVIKSGADIIESDLPTEAAEAIKPLIPGKSDKAKYFRIVEAK
ncbi:glycerophosphodiester phosphodiesterase family protein [Rufibacter hautae]|uniref:Glycerophosphodiester phosphodiesterase family protein n=1 Tax=Rufibacter hautae TaxID=2595005 RepID=A0A5B6TGZ7_9BACT|nr:glycerophosphodiester phosphodiesterase family protein [Rufibacter hautae]